MSENVDTICVQGGYQPGNGESRTPPIIQATTFKYQSSEQMSRLFDLSESGYFYTRLQNPTNDTVAAKICELEGGAAAMLTSSGQAANFFALFNICNNGDHIVASSAIYGGTFNLINVTMRKMGVECTFVSPDCTEEELEAAFQPNTKAVFGESISNPALIVLDFEKFANAAHRHGVPLIVDNTFPTPSQLPSVPVWRGHRHARHHQVHGRSRLLRGRRNRGFRQLRLDGSCGEIPGTHHSGRLLPWRDLRQGIRQGRLHHQSHRTAYARFRLNTGTNQLVDHGHAFGVPRSTHGAPLRERAQAVAQVARAPTRASAG